MNVDPCLIDLDQAQPVQRVERVHKLFARGRGAGIVEQYLKQLPWDCVGREIGRHREYLVGERSFALGGLDRDLPRGRDRLRIRRLRMVIEQLGDRERSQELEVVVKARASRAVRARVRQRERKEAERSRQTGCAPVVLVCV